MIVIMRANINESSNALMTVMQIEMMTGVSDVEDGLLQAL